MKEYKTRKVQLVIVGTYDYTYEPGFDNGPHKQTRIDFEAFQNGKIDLDELITWLDDFTVTLAVLPKEKE